MQRHLFQYILPLLFLFPALATAQDLWQLMSAEEYLRMPSGPEKTERIRDLESKGWYHQDKNTYYNLKGQLTEPPKVDLSPYVDEKGETVFLVTDVSPEFPGGSDAFLDYLQNAVGDLLIKPGESVQNSVYIKFTIEKDGSITEVMPDRIAEWIPGAVVERCKNAVQEMPNWSPGIYKDRPVKVRMLKTFSLRE